MELLDCMKKREFVIHQDDVPWKTVADGLRIKELLCEKTYGKSEFYLGVAELEVGKDIPAHKSNLACIIIGQSNTTRMTQWQQTRKPN